MRVPFCALSGNRLGETVRHYRPSIARVLWYTHHDGFLSSKRLGVGAKAYHTCHTFLWSGCGAALYPTGMLALGPIAPSRFLACSRLLSFCNTAARFGAAPRDDDDDDNIPR
jgi:hypothetical protein